MVNKKMSPWNSIYPENKCLSLELSKKGVAHWDFDEE